MENSESNQELLENVTISDVGGSQYMIQRMAVDNSQLIHADLLSQHGGLVVDLASSDFIPVNYTSEDLLNQDLTEEDRNLAAALVAVQLSQQQKQQQLQQDSSNVVINQSIPGLVQNSTIGVPKVEISEQQLILSDKTANAINTRYLQIVGNDNIYETYDEHIKSEDDTDTQINTKDSDGENRSDNRSSRKSLPHKKRISRKLKKTCVSLRKLHKCTLCEQTFSTEEFVQHQSICHTTITPVNPTLFSCQLCQSSFQDQLSFFEHLKSHYEPSIQVEPAEPTEEHDCKEGIRIDSDTPKDSLLSSLLSLHCIGCNKTFRRQKTYEAHVREIHSKVELTEFSEPEDLMAGIDVVVGTNEPSSDDDTKSWSKYRDEELHATEEDLRELEAQDHVCHICKQPFPMRAILLQHLITCRTSNDQPEILESNINNVPKKKTKKKVGELSCTDCDRVFAHRNSLIYHMRSHTGDRPHQCEHCGKSFFAASALKVHMRLHSGDKPYKCEHCGRNFRQWGDLKYHTISLHSDQKQYQCEYCGKDFARKYSLIVHRRIHTGERNYKCEFCGKSFRASSYLQNHRRIHTGEKPHPCEVCGKPFRVRSDMKRHMKTHGRRRMTRPAQLSTEMVVTKVEKSYSSEKMVDSDDTSQNQMQESESAVQALQYEQTPLEAVRDGNTLYTNGHQLFVLYTSGTQMRSVEAASNWSQSS